MNDTVITTKVDLKTKEQATKTAEALGMPLSVVIKALLKQFIRSQSLYVSIDNEEPTASLLSDLRQSEEDKKAGREFKDNLYVNAEWINEVCKNYGYQCKCGVAFEVCLEDGKVTSNLTVDRKDNSKPHHKTNCFLRAVISVKIIKTREL